MTHSLASQKPFNTYSWLPAHRTATTRSQVDGHDNGCAIVCPGVDQPAIDLPELFLRPPNDPGPYHRHTRELLL